jgi:hypothetical protein
VALDAAEVVAAHTADCFAGTGFFTKSETSVKVEPDPNVIRDYLRAETGTRAKSAPTIQKPAEPIAGLRGAAPMAIVAMKHIEKNNDWRGSGHQLTGFRSQEGRERMFRQRLVEIVNASD